MEKRKAKINLIDIVMDDYTHQLSLSRIIVCLVVVLFVLHSVVSVYNTGTLSDIPSGWLTLLLGQYGINKGASVVASINEPKSE